VNNKRAMTRAVAPAAVVTTAPEGAATTRDVATGGAMTPSTDSQSAIHLFTDRPSFEQQWGQALAAVGLTAVPSLPGALPQQIQKGLTVVLDAGSPAYDEEEVLAHVGLARALGAEPVVVVPEGLDTTAIDDILDDLCGGLVARRAEDIARLAMALARRAEGDRGRRFEYLSVSPRGGELLAILSDGTATLLSRPIDEGDDGTPVEAIELSEDASRALLGFASGERFELTADRVAQKHLLRGGATGERRSGDGLVDGVRLGQRIRTLRLAAGLTQAELARRTGIHRPNIARVEAGRHTPSLETLARLASAIGVPTTRVLDDG
jgi:DNA-binding XRE family transcriptional regulator